MSIEKTKRNAWMYSLSKRGGGQFSYRDLQKKFGFKSVKTVCEILNREHSRRENKAVK